MESLILERSDKKKTGQFYTPGTIVDYMIQHLDIKSGDTVLDSSCGSGVFLVKSLCYLKEKYGVQNPISNIYGVDINQDAVKQTRQNLIEYSDPCYENLIMNNVRVGNSIRTKENQFVWEKAFPSVMRSGGFDFIIGNPPYVTLEKDYPFDRSDKIYNEVTNGVINAASLITATGYELLKPGGVLSFLLPKSITRVASYEKLRKFLIKNAEIMEIFDLGLAFKDVRGEQIILTVKKKSPKRNSIIISKYTNSQKDISDQNKITIKQEQYKDNNHFLIFTNPKLYKIAAKLKGRSETLEELTERKIFRGVAINHDLLMDSPNDKHCLPVVQGKMVQKFHLQRRMYISSKTIEDKYLTKLALMKKDKVIIQNIYSGESGIKAHYDNKGLMTTETVTNIICGKINPKFLLALLSSKLITFYLTYIIFNGSKLTMHTDRQYIGQLPIIPNPEKSDLQDIINLVNKIDADPLSIKEYMPEIDAIVYKMYGVDAETSKSIDNELKLIMSRRSYW